MKTNEEQNTLDTRTLEEMIRAIVRDECQEMIRVYDEEVVSVNLNALANRVVFRYEE